MFGATIGMTAPALPEKILEPNRPIIDAHHHLYDRPGLRYLADDFLSDLGCGHAVKATVFVQARHAHLTTGPEKLRPIGETAFAAAVARHRGAAHYGMNAAIVPFANLLLGVEIRPVLEAHLSAGQGRVKAIRHILAWDKNRSLLNSAYPTTERLMDEPSFRDGLRELPKFGLGFEAWVLHPQLPRLAALADALPQVTIAVNHCGGPVVRGPGPEHTRETFAEWKNGVGLLARCPNVYIKLSGLGMRLLGIGRAGKSCASARLASLWRPWMETCIDLFGPDRCMFASNFPADRVDHDYCIGWNAMKHLASAAGEDEKDALFRRTAARFYQLASYASQN